MVETHNNDENRVLASLSPEVLDRLADLVVDKLISRGDRRCYPKQGVEGSNPLTRFLKSLTTLQLCYTLQYID
ncbi:hypothetical protein ACFLT8_01245 [Chloroflexota bacterium]